MQIFKVFGPSGKLCERMDHDGTHIVYRRHIDSCIDPVGLCETVARQPRNTHNTPCETRETAARHLRDIAKQPRDSRETHANPCRRLAAARP